MRYWHFTEKNNVFPILREGLKATQCGVFFCKSIDDCMKFIAIRQKEGLFAFIPLDLDESEVYESFDHNRKFIDCDAFYYPGDIPADKMPQSLNEIPLYEITFN